MCHAFYKGAHSSFDRTNYSDDLHANVSFMHLSDIVSVVIIICVRHANISFDYELTSKLSEEDTNG